MNISDRLISSPNPDWKRIDHVFEWQGDETIEDSSWDEITELIKAGYLFSYEVRLTSFISPDNENVSVVRLEFSKRSFPAPRYHSETES